MAMSHWAATLILVFGCSHTVKSMRQAISETNELSANASGPSGSCEQWSYPKFRAFDAQKNCEGCTQQPGCKWCPLDQRCVKSGSRFTKGGVSCLFRRDYKTIDGKIKKKEECSRTPPWHTILKGSFGSEYHKNSSKIKDAVRCIQWTLNWEVHRDNENTSNDDEGMWGCMSALLRSALLMSLGNEYHWTGGERITDNLGSLLQDGSNQTGFAPPTGPTRNLLRSDWYYDKITWDPALCDFIKLKFPTAPCYARAWKIEEFRELMKVWHKSTDLVGLKAKMAHSIKMGPIRSMVPGAGKSGSSFGMLADGSYKVKLGLKYSAMANSPLVSEPETLMSLLSPTNSALKSMRQHFMDHPESLINRIYGMFKLRVGGKSTYVLMMDDAFYNMDTKIDQQNTQAIPIAYNRIDQQNTQAIPIAYNRYDLKGLSRNQSERVFKAFCLINGDFKAMEQARVRLHDEQCMSVRAAVEADTNFLTDHNLIDYSLLLLSAKPEFRALTGATTATVDSHHVNGNPETDLANTVGTWSFPHCPMGNPFCMSHKQHLYTFSIIDYLNKYNLVKGVESVLRGGKFNRYGHQLTVFVRKSCPTSSEFALQKKLHKVMKEHGDGAIEAWKKTDVDGNGKVNMTEMESYFQSLGFTQQDFAQFIGNLEFDESEHANFDEFKVLID